MTLIAGLRPNDWDFPLFLHVLGAMVLVGGLVVAVASQLLASRPRHPADVSVFDRAGFWALLAAALPGWILMRFGAQWTYSKEGYNGENDPSWLGVGFTTADIGIIVLVVAVVLAGVGVRRLRRAGGGTNLLGRIATPLSTILLVAYLVAVWAMTAKPD